MCEAGAGAEDPLIQTQYVAVGRILGRDSLVSNNVFVVYSTSTVSI